LGLRGCDAECGAAGREGESDASLERLSGLCGSTRLWFAQYRNGVDTSALVVTLFTDGAPEDLVGCPSLGAVALVRTLEVVELDEGCVQSRSGVETSDLLVTLCADGVPEDLGGGSPLDAVALVGALEVAEVQECIQRSLEQESSTEAAPPKGNPPTLVEDRPLEAFDEYVGPCVTGLRPGVPSAEEPMLVKQLSA